MLSKIKFDIVFSNGKTLTGDHTFHKGMTAIVGPNESGKSMRLEMIRYALFGAKALRGSLATYSSIKVSLVITIGGTEYKITRTNLTATLYREGTKIVTGTGPVNSAVVKLFGYNLDVFDIANACLQGQVELLTEKTPEERKKMVDQTVGLNVIDTMYTMYTSEVSASTKAIVALKAAQGPHPIPPVEPSGYIKSEVLKSKLDEVIVNYEVKNSLKAKMAALFAVKPEPLVVTITTSLEELMELNNRRVVLNGTLAGLRARMAKLPDIDWGTDYSKIINKYKEYLDNGGPLQWARYNEWCLTKASLERTPICSEEELAIIRRYHTVAGEYYHVANLEDCESITCPHCHTDFKVNHDKIMAIKANWSKDVTEELIAKGYSLIDTYRLHNENDCKAMEARIHQLLEFNKQPPVMRPDFEFLGDEKEARMEIATAESRLAVVEESITIANDTKAIIEELKNLPDPTQDIQVKKQEEAQRLDYEVKLDRYNTFVSYTASIAGQLKQLDGIEDEKLYLENRLNESKVYESLVREYGLQIDNFNRIEAEITELAGKITELNNIRKALNELKPKVKSYLIPSLARVSSNFLSQMTNNERNSIDINNNFDILVDGQPVETLSGSGKAVANLAVRLGLGTVLTNKVFSVLLADEVDASMDDDRAAYTAQCLRNLTKVFSQIVLVSHQKPVADNYIEL